ncbi:MAG: metallophosphoesterase [Promethearchaeati archaeon]
MRNKKTLIGFIILLFLILSYLFILIPQSLNNDGDDDSNYKEDELTPKGIRLTTFQNLNGTIILSWYTEKNATDPLVEYSLDEDLSINKTCNALYFNIQNTHTYAVILNDLIPNSTYFYRIRSDKYNYREVLFFKSLPNKTDIKNFSFSVYGDSRTEVEDRTALANRMNNFSLEQYSDFSFHSGDIVADGRFQAQWNTYFENVEELYSHNIALFLEGNHERGDLSSLMYDNLYPGFIDYKRYYSFVFGNCGFVILNSNGYYDLYQEDNQTDWLNKTLYEYSKENEINFVFLHHPLLSTRSEIYHRTDWPPLFQKYNVTCVFSGHNHHYERSYPIINQSSLDPENYTFDDSDKYNYEYLYDPIYIVSGGAGAPLYDTYDYDYIARAEKIHHFCFLEIIQQTTHTIISLEAWGMPIINSTYGDLQMFDNFTIKI